MTYVPVTSTAATTAAAAAAERAKREEEEELTKYNDEELDQYEFKIMRSSLGKFSKYETVKRVCEQESKAGWELVEKFDQYRIRFKRKIEHRANDQFLDFDPYRTSMAGGGKSARILIILLVAGVIAAGGIIISIIAGK